MSLMQKIVTSNQISDQMWGAFTSDIWNNIVLNMNTGTCNKLVDVRTIHCSKSIPVTHKQKVIKVEIRGD